MWMIAYLLRLRFFSSQLVSSSSSPFCTKKSFSNSSLVRPSTTWITLRTFRIYQCRRDLKFFDWLIRSNADRLYLWGDLISVKIQIDRRSTPGLTAKFFEFYADPCCMHHVQTGIFRHMSNKMPPSWIVHCLFWRHQLTAQCYIGCNAIFLNFSCCSVLTLSSPVWPSCTASCALTSICSTSQRTAYHLTWSLLDLLVSCSRWKFLICHRRLALDLGENERKGIFTFHLSWSSHFLDCSISLREIKAVIS